MYYDEKSGTNNFVAGVLLGAILGAGIALLTAPQSGKTTRARLIRRGGRDEMELSAREQEEQLEIEAAARARKRRRRKAGR